MDIEDRDEARRERKRVSDWQPLYNRLQEHQAYMKNVHIFAFDTCLESWLDYNNVSNMIPGVAESPFLKSEILSGKYARTTYRHQASFVAIPISLPSVKRA